MCLMYSSSFFQTWSCHHSHTRKQPGRLPCSISPKKHKTLSSIPRAPRGTSLGHHLCRSSSFCSVGEYLSVCPLETSLPLVCLKSAPISYESYMVWYHIMNLESLMSQSGFHCDLKHQATPAKDNGQGDRNRMQMNRVIGPAEQQLLLSRVILPTAQTHMQANKVFFAFCVISYES